jgi:hypothetical protein
MRLIWSSSRVGFIVTEYTEKMFTAVCKNGIIYMKQYILYEFELHITFRTYLSIHIRSSIA